MPKKASRWVNFKRFLKRNLTPTWAKHFAYQVVSFVISVVMVIGVANYAITKSYEERTLKFVDGFTITAHTGSFGTDENSIESVKASLKNNVDVLEFDVRQRPNGTIVMAHDLVVTNNDGTDIKEVFEVLRDQDVEINLDIKETKVLNGLHDLLVEYGLYDNSFLTGIETGNIEDLRASSCRDMTYYLNCSPSRIKIFSEDYQKKLLDTLSKTGAVGVNCNYSFAGAQLSNLLHKSGYKLSVWTVDKSKDMKHMLAISPDNITTKEYDKLLSIIDNWGK